MKILLYDYHDLEERSSSHLRVWKAWHTILYICAAISGIVNFIFLQNTMELVDDNCVLYPKELEFHWIKIPNVTEAIEYSDRNETVDEVDPYNNMMTEKPVEESTASNKNAQNETVPLNGTESEAKVKREIKLNDTDHEYVSEGNDPTVEDRNETLIISENRTHRIVLHTSRSLFETGSACQFAEYMPLLSTVFAAVWATLFIMCPGGGRTRTGLQQPWRILAPALLFALVLVALTGYSFTSTNSGLHEFCAAFHNYTNTTTCSAVNPFLERSWNATWGFGGRASATRAAAAGVWVSWACAAALLLARCLAAPDFQVRRTGVYLIQDPQQKVIPHLKKSSQRSANSSPSKKETASVKSDPTVTTELVTASVEREPDSDPTSLTATPLKTGGEAIEMTYNPRELITQR